MQLAFCCFTFHKNYLAKVAYFSKINYHQSYKDPRSGGASINPTSQVRTSGHVSINDCKKLKDSKFEVANVHTKFRKNRSDGLEVERWRHSMIS